MKNNKGQITIMMIVTVIVLIIVVGVCIFMLTGENGLFIPKGYRKENETTQERQNTLNTQAPNLNNTVNETSTIPTE